MTPAPPPIALAPIASAAGTTGDLPAFASAAEASIPQYASQVTPSADSGLALPVNAWDAMLSSGAPALGSAAPALGSAAPASPFTNAPAANPYPFRTAPPPAIGTAVVPTPAPSWVGGGYEKPLPPPSNGKATAGFVLSLLGFNVIGLIVSIGGLRRARELETMGMPPVGRVLARWGVGLSTVSMVLMTILVSLILTVGPALFPFLSSSAMLPGANSTSSTVLEASIWDGLMIETDLLPDTVDCPANATSDPGTSVDCIVTLVDGQVVTVRATFMDDGSRMIEQVA